MTPASMVTRKADPWPAAMEWLGAGVDPLRVRILERARLDVGVLEEGENRGPRIDRYLRRCFVPEPIILAGRGWWCAAGVGAWFVDAGAKVPQDYGSCDAWLPFMVPATFDTLATVGRPGDAVLFGVPGDAKHIEVLFRTAPRVLTIGGNKSFGAAVSNNGDAVDVHALTRRDVLGVVRPIAATP